MKFSPRGYVEHLKRKKMLAMMEAIEAMQEQIEWEPLPPDAPEATVFVGGKPMPISEFIEKYQPEAKP